jgi:hypothetical protein
MDNNDYDNWKLAEPYDVEFNDFVNFSEKIKVSGTYDESSNYHAKEWDLFTNELRVLCKKYNYKVSL